MFLSGVIAFTSVDVVALANGNFIQQEIVVEDTEFEENLNETEKSVEEERLMEEENCVVEVESDSREVSDEDPRDYFEETSISENDIEVEIGENLCVEEPVMTEEYLEEEVAAEEMEASTVEAETTILQEETKEFEWGDIIEEDRLLYATEEYPLGDVTKVPDGMWLAGIKTEGYTYSGQNIVFDGKTNSEIRVYDGKTLLKPQQDYTIAYKNNKNAYILTDEDPGYNPKKAPTVIFTGKGNYSGTITKNFLINPVDFLTLNEAGNPMFQIDDITLAYNGKVQKGTPKVTYTDASGKTITLKAKKDFEVIYPGTQAGEDYNPLAFKEASDIPYTGLVVGCGNFTGTLEFQEKITSSILISKVKISAIKAQSYTGEPVEPEVTLQYKGEVLKEYDEETQAGDYTLSYQNNIKAGTASIIITGKGKYAGNRTVTFKINGINLKKAKLEGFQSAYVYTGDQILQENVQFSYISPDETIVAEENKHYKVEYINNEKVGTATVVYQGIEENGWSGIVKKKFKITAYDLNADTQNRITVTDQAEQKYPQYLDYVKGGVKPQPKVIYTSPSGKEYLLSEGNDYKLSYSKNNSVYEGNEENKMATIKIVGKGNFKGTRQKEKFGVCRAKIGRLNLAAADKVYQNKKGKYQTTVTVTDVDGKKLKAGADYETKMAYYYGESVLLENGTYRYYGDSIEKNDIVPAGTRLMVEVTGKGNYEGNTSIEYRIVGIDLSKAVVRVSKQYYTGQEICPDKSQIVVILNGKVVRDADYEIVSYSNNINKGTAKLTLRGVGNYGGSNTVNFTIANKSMFYMISFHPNGATSGNMKDLRLWYNKSYTLSKNTYQKTGYKFIGWNTKPDGSGRDADGDLILYPDKAKDPIGIDKEDMGKLLVLYAQWKMENYKITYKLGGGVNSEENPAAYTIIDEIKLKEPTKKGYVFVGWYTDSKFTASKKISRIAAGTAGDLVLYAKWRETFVGEVELPQEGTYLNVWDYGAIPGDEKDDTNAIEEAVWEASANYKAAKEALEAEYGEEAAKEMKVEAVHTVYVPAGIYNVTAGHAHYDGDPGISMKSNVNLIMDPKAVLVVSETDDEDYCVISAKNVENITIRGGRIQGERYRHIGKEGEGGHGIAVYGGQNVVISDISIESNWGDGIYLGTQAVKQSNGKQKYVGCDQVTIKNCDIFDNRRSNISVTDADNLKIDHCYIFDAHGTAPQCGICIEPNSNSSGDKICKNIELKDTVISAYQNKNDPEYMCFMTHYNPYVSGYTTSENIWFKNCVFNGYVGNYSGNNLHYDSKTIFNGEFDNHR